MSDGRGPVCRFAAACDARSCGCCGYGSRARGPAAAFRWHGAPGEDAALACHQGVAEEAGRAGLLAGGVGGFARVAEGVLRAAW